MSELKLKDLKLGEEYILPGGIHVFISRFEDENLRYKYKNKDKKWKGEFWGNLISIDNFLEKARKANLTPNNEG